MGLAAAALPEDDPRAAQFRLPECGEPLPVKSATLKFASHTLRLLNAFAIVQSALTVV